MLQGSPILSAIIFTPCLGAFLLLVFRAFVRADSVGELEKRAPAVALWASLFTLMLTLVMVFSFDPGEAGYQFVEEASWLGGGVAYRLGVDGISVLFVVLTALLTPLCILASWRSITTRMIDYMIAFLVLETLMLGVFCALDLVLFYVFFEAGLIPMFLIIGIWGGERRVYAAFKFFLYTLLGSLVMLVAILWIYFYSGEVLGSPTMDIRTLTQAVNFPAGVQTWLWLAFFASFAVKLPMWPVHTWLPAAHV